MPTPYEGRTPPPGAPPHQPQQPRPPRLCRAAEGAWLAGVCRGLADQLGADVRVVRVVVVVLTVFGGGFGAVLYLALWAVTPQRMPRETPADDAVSRVRGILGDGASTTTALGVLLAAGALLLLSGGTLARLGIVLPLVLVAAGAVLTWSQLDRSQRARWVGADRDGWWRVALGASLAVAGLAALAAQGRGVSGVVDSAVSGLVVLAGVGVIAAPWVLRGWDELRREQAERVRATERADLAAHLHDSVLQSLALIQRRADDPALVARVARAQERELRAWLYGGGPARPDTLAAAATAAVHEVEDVHGVPVDLVVTGDAPLDDDGGAFVRALAEACSNAVRHGGPPVSVYLEVGAGEVEAFVRDHGPGFDLDAVPADRAGVRHSVIGRLRRRGGDARFRRLDEGTEVSLRMPRPPVPASGQVAPGLPVPAADRSGRPASGSTTPAPGPLAAGTSTHAPTKETP